MEVTLSPKYQLLVPKNVRRGLKLQSGQKFQVIAKEGIIAFVPDYSLKKMKGMFKELDTKGLRDEEARI